VITNRYFAAFIVGILHEVAVVLIKGRISEAARSAFDFAIVLAQTLELTVDVERLVHLIHVVQVPASGKQKRCLVVVTVPS